VFRNPRESEVVSVYAHEELHDTQLFDAHLQFFRSKIPALGKPGSILEVGSYLGAFLVAAKHAGLRAKGIDVNESANRFARARGANVTTATIEDYRTSDKYDVVAFWNCLDQLPDPRAALLKARELLKPNGQAIMRVPNGGSYSAFQKRPLFLAYNNLLSFPYRQGFTTRGLKQLLDETGFEATKVRGDALPTISNRWTKRWAKAEQQAVQSFARLLPRSLAPWIEVYASATVADLNAGKRVSSA